MESTATTPANNTKQSELPSAFHLFKPSWEAIKLNIGTFLTLFLVPLVFQIVLFVSMGSSFNSQDSSTTNVHLSGSLLAMFGIILLVWLLTSPAILVTQVKSAQGSKITISDAFEQGLRLLPRLIGLGILIGLAVGIGFILLIVPGLLILKRCFLAPYVLVAEDLGVIDSIKRSNELSKQPKSVWGVLGVTMLLGLIGIIPLIGSIISFVGGLVYACAPAIRYQQLVARVN